MFGGCGTVRATHSESRAIHPSPLVEGGGAPIALGSLQSSKLKTEDLRI
jgi:hypothetical protein